MISKLAFRRFGQRMERHARCRSISPTLRLPGVKSCAPGPFDILVNNAGVSRHRPMLETQAEDFDYVLSINLRAAYFVAKSVAAGMVEAGRPGAIIQYFFANGPCRCRRPYRL